MPLHDTVRVGRESIARIGGIMRKPRESTVLELKIG